MADIETIEEEKPVSDVPAAGDQADGAGEVAGTTETGEDK